MFVSVYVSFGAYPTTSSGYLEGFQCRRGSQQHLGTLHLSSGSKRRAMQEDVVNLFNINEVPTLVASDASCRIVAGGTGTTAAQSILEMLTSNAL